MALLLLKHLSFLPSTFHPHHKKKDPNEETEWNDILRKHKIIGERQKTELELNAEAAEEMLAAHVENVSLSKGGTCEKKKGKEGI